VDLRTAQVFGADDFTGDGFDDGGTGDEHASVFGLDDEVGERRAVDGATGARSGDDGDLGDDAGGFYVGVEDTAIAAEAVVTFLNTGPAGVVDDDEGGAGFEGVFHCGDNFVGVDFADGAAGYGEVLAGDVDEAAVDAACAGDDAFGGHYFAVHAEVGAAMFGIHAAFKEAVLVEHVVETFTGGEAADCVLFVDFVTPAAKGDLGFLVVEFLDFIFYCDCHGSSLVLKLQCRSKC